MKRTESATVEYKDEEGTVTKTINDPYIILETN